jgi:tRNA dimethylallyltransferase
MILSADTENRPFDTPVLVILGPTASGKTHLATRVAYELGGEIVSGDSRQVYRGMTIGTGKDLDEFVVKGQSIPYHLIDILDAGEKYNVSRFQADFGNAYDHICRNRKIPILCGGSGLYIDSVLREYAFTGIPVDEKLRLKLDQMDHASLELLFSKLPTAYSLRADTSTRKRLIRAIEISFFLSENPDIEAGLSEQGNRYRSICFGLNPPVELRRERISRRLNERLGNGLVEEVEGLLASGLAAEQLVYYGLEYKYITQFLTGELSADEMKRRLETEIHRFAKRQMTFFRKMEKDGISINWLDSARSVQEHVDEIVTEYQSFAKSLQ